MRPHAGYYFMFLKGKAIHKPVPEIIRAFFFLPHPGKLLFKVNANLFGTLSIGFSKSRIPCSYPWQYFQCYAAVIYNKIAFRQHLRVTMYKNRHNIKSKLPGQVKCSFMKTLYTVIFRSCPFREYNQRITFLYFFAKVLNP